MTELNNRIAEQNRQIALLEKDKAGLERAVQEKEIQIEQLASHLALIKKSLIWRTSEFFRRLIYVKALGRFPRIQKLVLTLRKDGIVNFLKYRKFTLLGLFVDDYKILRRWNRLTDEKIAGIEEETTRFSYKPRISIVMPVYNVDEAWLRQAIDSVIAQFYPNWELCIADDGSPAGHVKKILEEYGSLDKRITVRRLSQNQGIIGASNAALALATGEYCGFLDHDDELSPDALFEVVKALNGNQDLDLIYSDEDKISEKGVFYDPFFKPDWSPDTLRSYNYICHFTVVRTSVMRKVGGFHPGYEGSQDYDLFLRVSESTEHIAHIPKVLYHWRSIEGSVGKNPEAKMYAYESARKALSDHIDRLGFKGAVARGPELGTYRIRYRVRGNPRVAVIIPTRDRVDILKRCLDSILEKTTYGALRIVVVDNGSQAAETLAYYDRLDSDERVELLNYPHPFNFSAINNFAAGQTEADHLVFLNNDTEVISPGWIETMLGFSQRPDVGAVGALLLYGDDTVQHGGVVIGIGGVAGHLHKHFPKDALGYFCRLKISQNLSAVTAACMMTRKSVFESVGGFDERMTHAFNDVDLCLGIGAKGYRIVYAPEAMLYHHESVSRGFEDTPEKQARFLRERKIFNQKWQDRLDAGDPYYNSNLTLAREDCSLWRPGDDVDLASERYDFERIGS